MYRSFLFLPALAVASMALGQQQLHQLFILSEGYYNYATGEQLVPVTLGTYDPASNTYLTVATIPGARFGNDVKVESGLVYISADSFLLKYDADSYALLDQEIVHGIRRIALWNDDLVLTRAELGGLSHYVEVRDKNTFDLLYTIDPADGIPYTCEAVEVVGDKAYIAMNNGFDWPNYTNLVAVVDLVSQSFETAIDLGPDGYDPEHLMVSDGDLYVFNNKDYTGSSISRIETNTANVVYTNNVALSSGCGTSAAVAEKIYYMEYAVGQLARYDLATAQVQDTLTNELSAYGLIGNPVDQVLYVTTTDFVNEGTLYVTEHDGTILGSTAIGISSSKMALDLRLSTGLAARSMPGITLFPNPADQEICIVFPESVESGVLVISDATGREVARGSSPAGSVHRVGIDHLEPGVYTVRADGFGSERFIKR